MKIVDSNIDNLLDKEMNIQNQREGKNMSIKIGQKVGQNQHYESAGIGIDDTGQDAAPSSKE